MKRVIILAIIGMSVILNAQSKKVVCDGNSCRIEDAAKENGYSVVSPVPESAIEPMESAPRLKSLNGKTIALVGERRPRPLPEPRDAQPRRLPREGEPHGHVRVSDAVVHGRR